MRKLHAIALVLSSLFISNTQAADHCVVLQYHHISEDTPGITSVTPERFQQHLDYLKDNKFNVMALEDVVEALKNKQPVADKCIALTIDDAFISTYTEAWPRARKYNYPLTVFVSTESVDLNLSAYMTWEQLREISKNGVTLQNHSHSHDHLVRKNKGEAQEDWEQRIASEMLLAKNRIQTETGITPSLFAYPYGEYNNELRSMVRSMGMVGFGQQSGPIWSEGDFAALPRFPMASVYASMKTFPTKVKSLPMPIVKATPSEPIVDIDEWQPTLTLSLKPDSYKQHRLTCYANGSPAVQYLWPKETPNTVQISTKGKLGVGRNRYNCTMPSKESGRFHWYSHNWIRRLENGEWYKETR